ncbi:hypothetical protein EJB05_54199, partial [Eragrostis curvula]
HHGSAGQQQSATGCVVAAAAVSGCTARQCYIPDARRHPGCGAEEKATLRCTAAAMVVRQFSVAAHDAGSKTKVIKSKLNPVFVLNVRQLTPCWICYEKNLATPPPATDAKCVGKDSCNINLDL